MSVCVSMCAKERRSGQVGGSWRSEEVEMSEGCLRRGEKSLLLYMNTDFVFACVPARLFKVKNIVPFSFGCFGCLSQTGLHNTGTIWDKDFLTKLV